jgi:hypothetical protein
MTMTDRTPVAQPGRPPEDEPTHHAPRWVKVTGIIALALATLVLLMMLTGHGPARHTGEPAPWLRLVTAGSDAEAL